MIGLISAMRVEIEALLEDMLQKETILSGKMVFTVGELYGMEAVLCVCGPGKVNAAVYTDTLIHLFKPNCVINLGVAGAIASSIEIGDIVVADFCVQHDVDTTALGDPPGLISGLSIIQLPSDKRLSDRLLQAAKSAELKAYRGMIATGDQFVSGMELKKRILQRFDCLACEMEGGAVAQACYMHQIPVCVVRAISDKADGSAHMDYTQFTALAAKRSMALMKAHFDVLSLDKTNADTTF